MTGMFSSQKKRFKEKKTRLQKEFLACLNVYLTLFNYILYLCLDLQP